MTTDPTLEAVSTATDVDECSAEDCPRPAVVAMRFRLQPGHVHECAQHAAELREWCDVSESTPLPCPWDHGNGQTWTDYPRELT